MKRNGNYGKSLLAMVLCLANLCTFSANVFAETKDVDKIEYSISEAIVQNENAKHDGQPSFAKVGDDFWFVYTDCERTIRRFKGTSMSDLVEQTAGKIVDKNGNDIVQGSSADGGKRYWTQGLWVDSNTGTWYTIIHCEANETSFIVDDVAVSKTRKILYATSTDNALTWRLQDEILVSDDPDSIEYTAGNWVSNGCGDPRLLVDERSGYFYIYYVTAWINKTNANSKFQQVCVARSPISSKMAQGTWTKWYNDSWSEPGIGGHDSALFAPPCTGVFVAYNTYLGKYMALGLNKVSTYDTNLCFVSYIDNLEDQSKWTRPRVFCGKENMLIYHWFMNPDTLSQNEIGKTFRLYAATPFGDEKLSKYYNITINDTEEAVESTKIVEKYMATSIFDFNTLMDKFPKDAYRRDFNGNLDSLLQVNYGGTSEAFGTFSALKLNNNNATSTMLIDMNSPKLSYGHLVFTVHPNNGNFGAIVGFINNKYRIIRYSSQGKFYIEEPSGSRTFIGNITLDNDKTYRIDINFDSTTVELLVDGVKVGNTITTARYSSPGKCGLYVSTGSDAIFDNLIYSKYNNEEIKAQQENQN